MIINRANLGDLRTGFRANFQAGFSGVAPMWNRIATLVPSATAEEKYPWLGQMPGMREWIGERQIKNIAEHGYSIRNRSFEDTVSVPRESIEDDQYGVYAPMMTELGRAVAAHPDQLVFNLIKAGFVTNCYDGQYFFDTDHPVLDEAGTETSVSNMQAGAGAAWYLLDTSRAIKPLIFQERKKPEFVMKDSPDDDNVFMRKEFIYGVDNRCNVGFGFWQMAFGSKATLDATNLQAAYTAMTVMKGDYGRPLGIMPNLLVVSPTNYFAALDLVKAQTKANGATNTLNGLVEVMSSPWLA
jgi:phage major head subunit gpT-like protein